jgi:CheY-like chemotaxis protein
MNISDGNMHENPPAILFVDRNPEEARYFFHDGMRHGWAGYELVIIDNMAAAQSMFEHGGGGARKADLLLISNNMWLRGGAELVRAIRNEPVFSRLPIYIVASCLKKLNHPNPQCFNAQWRDESDCKEDFRVTSQPYRPYLEPDHPARIDGVMCADNIILVLPRILDDMVDFWFNG